MWTVRYGVPAAGWLTSQNLATRLLTLTFDVHRGESIMQTSRDDQQRFTLPSLDRLSFQDYSHLYSITLRIGVLLGALYV